MELPVDDIIWNANSHVREAVKLPVLRSNDLLHPRDEGVQGTEAVLVGEWLAGRDGGQWKHTVVQNPANIWRHSCQGTGTI